jgi:hypothetical protein
MPTEGEEGTALLRAIAGELKGNLNERGIKRLGLTLEPRFAVYGIGLSAVVRFEIADRKRLMEAVKRVAVNAGLLLPPPRREGALDYWAIDDGGATLMVAVLERQVVAAIAARDDLPKLLPLILGVEKPARSILDSGALKKLAADYGFTGYGLGYIDFARMIDLLADKAGEEMPIACRGELSALAGRIPRLVLGYDQIEPKATSMTAVIELAPPLAKKLLAIRSKVPGMTPKMPAPPLFAVGVGADVDKALALGKELASPLARIGAACEFPGMVEASTSVAKSGELPIPPAFEGVRGAMLVVRDADLSAGLSNPTGIEAYGILASAKPDKIVDFVEKMSGLQLGLSTDGRFRELKLPMPMPIPLEVHAAIGKGALAVAVGREGQRQAQRALEQSGAMAPFLMIVYDFGRLAKIIGSLDPPAAEAAPGVGTLEKDILEAQAEILGTVGLWIYASERGLALTATMH